MPQKYFPKKFNTITIRKEIVHKKQTIIVFIHVAWKGFLQVAFSLVKDYKNKRFVLTQS